MSCRTSPTSSSPGPRFWARRIYEASQAAESSAEDGEGQDNDDVVEAEIIEEDAGEE